MKLENVKENLPNCFRIGYDKISHKYILETDDMSGNKRYFTISKEQ